MKKVALFLIAFLFFAPQASAMYDPLARPNNFHGIHILFPTELNEASELVNSSNGQWGYVTIPIQATDRDLEKWQNFMDQCAEKKLIPIVRLATEPLYSNTSVWRIPTEEDIIDSANFLNSLEWPIENRYIIVYNEINRYDEWGGEAPNPERYGEILAFAYDVFKRRSEDFYMIMGGMDNASPNDRIKYMDNMVFIEEMLESNPEIVKKMDGFSSHSYPNPGFSQPPSDSKLVGTSTYKYEYELLNESSEKKIPAFITETGWVSDNLSPDLVASYYKTAYETIWKEDSDKIVAITPFLLNSTGGQFENFSFIINGSHTKQYESKKSIAKTRGEPIKAEVKGIEVKAPAVKKEKFFAHTLGLNNNSTEDFIVEYIRFFF